MRDVSSLTTQSKEYSHRTAVFDMNEHAVNETVDPPISMPPPPFVATFVTNEHEVSVTVGHCFIPNAPPDPDLFEVNAQKFSAATDESINMAPPHTPGAYPLVNVTCWNAMVVLVPVSTITARLPLVPVLSPSNVQLPGAVPTAQRIETALVMQSEVGAEFVLPVHASPEYAVLDGVR
jgi:hypothetical protein